MRYYMKISHFSGWSSWNEKKEKKRIFETSIPFWFCFISTFPVHSSFPTLISYSNHNKSEKVIKSPTPFVSRSPAVSVALRAHRWLVFCYRGKMVKYSQFNVLVASRKSLLNYQFKRERENMEPPEEQPHHNHITYKSFQGQQHHRTEFFLMFFYRLQKSLR